MFHRGLKHSKTIKALCMRPRAFVSFLVFETPMKHPHSFLKYYLTQFVIVETGVIYSFTRAQIKKKRKHGLI